MPRPVSIIVVLAALLAVAVAVGGCGGADDEPSDASTVTGAVASTTPAPVTPATTTPATTTPSGGKSPYVVVSSLLGRPLPKEPGCRFNKTFTPDKPSASAYDGALTLTVMCPRADGYRPVGQIVNRRGSKPTEITCRETTAPQLYCIYVPSPYVGLYFTGTQRDVVRRRLEHLIETVQPLPTGITPLSGTSAP